MPEEEIGNILKYCHSSDYGGHFSVDKTVATVLQAGFYWPHMFKIMKKFILRYDRCQRVRNISRKNEMPQQGILKIELFDVWGIDFMGPFPEGAEAWKTQV